MTEPNPQEWKAPATWFAFFNLLVAPIGGRVVWYFMLLWNNEDLRMMSILLSIIGAVVILSVNVYLTRWARLLGMPRIGLTAMWLITGVTFLITIGFGFFSPINLILGFLRFGVGA